MYMWMHVFFFSYPSVGFQFARMCEIETGPVYFSIGENVQKNQISIEAKLILIHSLLFQCFKESLSVYLEFVCWQNRWVELSNRTHVHICLEDRREFDSFEWKRLVITLILRAESSRKRLKCKTRYRLSNYE